MRFRSIKVGKKSDRRLGDVVVYLLLFARPFSCHAAEQYQRTRENCGIVYRLPFNCYALEYRVARERNLMRKFASRHVGGEIMQKSSRNVVVRFLILLQVTFLNK